MAIFALTICTKTPFPMKLIFSLGFLKYSCKTTESQNDIRANFLLFRDVSKAHPTMFSKYNFLIIISREARAEGPSVARLLNLSGRAGPSRAKPREFERKIYLYIYFVEDVRTVA